MSVKMKQYSIYISLGLMCFNWEAHQGLSTNATTGINDVNITVGVADYVYHQNVIIEQYTWFQARNYCREARKNLAELAPGMVRFKVLQQFLRENEVSGTSTFWIGHFRPLESVETWYVTKGARCKASSSKVQTYIQDVDSGGSSCVAVFFNDTSYMNPQFVARDCSDRYAVICQKFAYAKTFVNYTGYSLQDVSNEALSTKTLDNISVEECAWSCMRDNNCALSSLNETGDQCSVYTFNAGYGQDEVSLVYTGENTSYWLRAGDHSVSYYTFYFSHTVPDEFPDCNISTTTTRESRCFCLRPITEREFGERLREMTVDPASTAKSKQTKTSAEDQRISSQTIGFVGVVVITFVIGCIVVPDAVTLIMNMNKLWKGHKRVVTIEKINESEC